MQNSEIILSHGMEIHVSLCYIVIGSVTITFCRKVHIPVKSPPLQQPDFFVNRRPVAERGERHLTLEQLAAETGLSKSALGKYEMDDYKDISPFAIATLADFWCIR